jgi:large subunit ribosomal protein L4|uniref:Large ribosomal subunit protein uL4c n=1 Tax=Discostella pseudostelligera TaxID=259834 RepID=A0A2U9NS90_9STRA|nr:ribosomal protein L4 [Discostella pseudostelligera]AWT39959.1 ribosomal protein L4 [Discostella pseudostelligera]
MTVQKIIEYNSLDSTGQISSDKYNFKLNILEDSGNYLIHRDILRHQISQKQGTVSTKTRSEVRGGGKKPWKQKGTGRARAGSSRSPLWRGGGVTFGPKPKRTTLKLNKKERNLALQTLFYNKRNNISVIGELESLINEPKTKVFCDICKVYNLDLNQKILLVVAKKTPYLKLSTQNLKNVELISASNLNTLSLLKAKQILLTPLAVNDIKEIYCD